MRLGSHRSSYIVGMAVFQRYPWMQQGRYLFHDVAGGKPGAGCVMPQKRTHGLTKMKLEKQCASQRDRETVKLQSE